MKQVKRILLTALSLLIVTLMYGQAKEASIMIDKQNRNAVTIAIDQPEKVTREALQQRLMRSGLKEKIKTGVMKYKGVTLSEIGPGVIDIYTKVEPGPANSSIVYMAVSKGYDNFTNGAEDSSLTQNVKTFLESFIKDADYHSADVGISSQLEDLAKDEKAYEQLINDQKDLQRKVTTMEGKIAEMQNDLIAKKEAIEKKKIAIDAAKSKRSSISGQ